MAVIHTNKWKPHVDRTTLVVLGFRSHAFFYGVQVMCRVVHALYYVPWVIGTTRSFWRNKSRELPPPLSSPSLWLSAEKSHSSAYYMNRVQRIQFCRLPLTGFGVEFVKTITTNKLYFNRFRPDTVVDY